MMNDFVCYGTPLKELDDDNVHKSKAPRIEDQIVTDENGKRRFHGAFTGGFSAGYYNSVGSKEGFIPSKFVSSRSKRGISKFSAYTPQDFMDEEDLAAYGIAPQVIRPTDKFNQHNISKRKYDDEPTGLIPAFPVLQELLKPSSETMGIIILKKLGWRPGQGIGPRKSRAEKKLSLKEKRKFYEPMTANVDSDDATSSDEDNCQLGFAPDDVVSSFLTKPKCNSFGLGYKPLDRHDIFGLQDSSNANVLNYKEKDKLVKIKGHAFGIGAFEDDDDDEVYTGEDMSRYDFALQSEQETKALKISAHISSVNDMSEFLEGFHLSCKGYESVKSITLPIVPLNFNLKHTSRKRRFEAKESSIRGLGRYELSTDDRKRILSEKPVIVEVRSGIKGQSSTGKKGDDHEEHTLIENDSQKPLINFKPFEKNSERQQRYDNYLKFRDQGMKDTFHSIQPKSMTDWEKENERREFERAASLYTPLSKDRFTSASFHETSLVLKDGLTDVSEQKLSSETKFTSIFGNIVNDSMKAAVAKMYGKLTQSQREWHPDRCLCKRFNVTDPYPNSTSVGVPGCNKNKEKTSIFNFLSSTPLIDFNSSPKDNSLNDVVTNDCHDEIPITTEEVEDYGFKIPVGDGSPKMDLFNAIFDDSDDEDIKAIECQLVAPSTNMKESSSINSAAIVGKKEISQSSTIESEVTSIASLPTPPSRVIFNPTSKVKKATGIFKDVDFKAINAYRDINTKVDVETPTIAKTIDKCLIPLSSDDEEYGPELPPSTVSIINSGQLGSYDTNSIPSKWIEKNKEHRSRHKLKKIKKKKTKKEKKHMKRSKKK